MTPWIEKLTGSLENKKRYARHRERVKAMPEPYRSAHRAIERYVGYYGAVTDGSIMMTMLEDLADLMERAAVDQMDVREVVGQDPVGFCETFVRNYADGQWISVERERLTKTIDSITQG